MLVLLGSTQALAQAPRDEEDRLRPFAASAMHVGGAAEFDWSESRIGDAAAESTATFTLNADVGYFLVEGLKVSGLPFFTVAARGEDYAVLVGAAAGVAYYLDLGPLAVFGRGRGGLLFGTTDEASASRQGDVNGFLYGGGVGAALPVGTNVIELAVEYVGSQRTLKSDRGSLEGAENGLFVRLGFLMVL